MTLAGSVVIGETNVIELTKGRVRIAVNHTSRYESFENRKSHPPGWDKKFEINPMHQSIGTRLDNLRRAPRCGATTRVGAPCQCPTMRGRKRCRLHGGLSLGAPRGARNGNFTDGSWTAEAIEERRWLRSLIIRSFGKLENTP